ncbi:MAG: hypothetical protein HW403_685 [Dehalococcoidia bacterium]|nr:hypothetical protein [Dehalococcoidia bacterium]
MQFAVEYYIRPRGDVPVQEWLSSLPKKDAAAIAARILKLGEEPFTILLGLSTIERIHGNDRDFYELKSGPYRVSFHRDPSIGKCVLLWGFRKTRQRETKEIEHARGLLHEYLNT